MTRWELLSETAAIVRNNFVSLVVIILPALLATYVVNAVFASYYIAPSEFRRHLFTVGTASVLLRLLQYFLGWSFLVFEFAAVAVFVDQAKRGSVSVRDAVANASSNGAALVKLSWALYWRALVVFVPVSLFIILIAASLFPLYRVFGIWFGTATVFAAFSFTALIGSKWLLALPDVVLDRSGVKEALQACNTQFEQLHEPLLVLSLLVVATITFGAVTWPMLLRYVYLPDNWPTKVVEIFQTWFTPVSSLIIETWATMMLFVGTTVLWMKRESLERQTEHADPLHR